MEIQQVQYFLEVCNERNFTKAAKRCGISQRSLTRAIKLLEKEFGDDLFTREYGRIELTELGKIVRPYLENVWEQTSTVKQLTRDMATKKAARLRLGVMCTIAPSLLIKPVSQFRCKYSDIQLDVIDGTAAFLEDSLLSSQIDIAIFARPNRELNPRLNYMRLFREQMMVVLPKMHRLANHSSLTVSDLTVERYVMRGACEFAEKVPDGSDQPSHWKIAYKSDRDDWVFAMIASGFGFGFAPEHSINRDDLVAVPLDPEIWREVHLTTALDGIQDRSVGAFVHEAMQQSWPHS